MNIDEKLRFIKPIVYHELGHVLGYILANKSDGTNLGKIKILKIGLRENLVTPKKSYYHIERDMILDTSRLQEATSNVERTIAWFIEVILGCTMQTIIENSAFTTCFQQKQIFNGALDYKNISDLRLVSKFKWNIQEIHDLQYDIKNLILKENLIDTLKPLVNNILEQIRIQNEHQIIYSQHEIIRLENQIGSLIPVEFHEEYLNIIKKYKQIFTQPQDLKTELNFISDNSNTPGYKSGEKFHFKFKGSDLSIIGKIRFIYKDAVKPGESIIAFISFENAVNLNGQLEKLMEFDFFSSSKTVGKGKIMDIYNN